MSRKLKDDLYYHFSRITRALSHPKRLEIIDLLSQGEKSVELIAEQASLGIKNASAQLKELKSAQLVDSRKDGKYVYYSVSDLELISFWRRLQSFSEKKFAEIQVITHEAFSQVNELEHVNKKSLLAKAKRGEIVLLDVRPQDEFEFGHLPYAISIPSNEISKRLKELPKDKEIVAYCRGPYCFMAKEAVEILRKKGFKAFRMKDSVHEWDEVTA
ncbi:MAG: ArsR/SmtB family transcription factor [Bacteriovoracia bacterium]